MKYPLVVRMAVLLAGYTAVAGLSVPASAAGSSSTTLARQFEAVRPSVRPYQVSPSLQQVTNLAQLNKSIPVSAAERRMLARNLFSCTRANYQQLFHIYENNDYLNIPSFVSTDLSLQLYHIFYDFTLRSVEADSLLPALRKLTDGMLEASVADWSGASSPEVKQAAMRNIAYFGVAARSLGSTTPLPADAAPLVTQELAMIKQHQGFEKSAIFPYRIDYSQFVPRGHYTRSPALKQYFQTMMWYGLVPFTLAYYDANGKLIRADDSIRQGLLLVRDLYGHHLDGQWQQIYEPTSFYVGFSDDLSPAEWKQVSDQVFGANPAPDDFNDPAKLQAFFDGAIKLRPARIQPKFGVAMGVPAGAPHMIQPPLAIGIQLRFMGQRYIPDSEVLQRLSQPIARVFPSGLDLMAVLGSSRAATILDEYPQVYNASHWGQYGPERAKLVNEFAAVPDATWHSNLYWSWLDTLRTLVQPLPAGYPSFMRNSAWLDKSLNTSLASWAELRHDTILYGKQSTVECGDGRDVPFVKGYVEPNVVFYDRLLELTKQSHDGLKQRGFLTPKLADRFEQFTDLLTLLRNISLKELHNEKLTEQEYEEIRYIGGKYELLTLSVMEGHPSYWSLVSQADKDMAVVADVHTGGDQVLEEAVGHPYQILVIVPIEGKLVLTRGACFSYDEFKHPAADRMTDESWQARIKAGTTPTPPPWTSSFLIPGRPLRSGATETYSSGC